MPLDLAQHLPAIVGTGIAFSLGVTVGAIARGFMLDDEPQLVARPASPWLLAADIEEERVRRVADVPHVIVRNGRIEDAGL